MAVVSEIGVRVDLIIKFGGSAITVKDQFETLKIKELEDAAEVVKACMELNMTCIVVHGAGSFGHFQAREYSVKSGYTHLSTTDAIEVKRGFVLGRQSVTKLNKMVVDTLVKQTIPAVSISPCGTWLTSDGTVSRDGVDGIQELLKDGFVPVLHGDACLDSKRGCTILSGDTVILKLCERLDVGRVVFLTDVDGIYNNPPHDKDAVLLPEISVDANGKIQTEIISRMTGCDVTGGVELKLDTAKSIVMATKGSTPVFVCRVNSPVARRVCCEGVTSSKGEGTLIRLKDS